MGGEVGQARLGEDRLRLMGAHRLQGIAIGALAMAVIDNQRRAAIGLYPLSDIRHVADTRGRLLEHLAGLSRTVHR